MPNKTVTIDLKYQHKLSLDHLMCAINGEPFDAMLAQTAYDDLKNFYARTEEIMTSDNSSKAKSFVLYRQPSEGKADIIYVGSNSLEALHTLLDFGNKNYSEVSELRLKQEE